MADNPGLAPGSKDLPTPPNQHPDCEGVLPDRTSPGGPPACTSPGWQKGQAGREMEGGKPLPVTPLSEQARWQAKEKRRWEP